MIVWQTFAVATLLSKVEDTLKTEKRPCLCSYTLPSAHWLSKRESLTIQRIPHWFPHMATPLSPITSSSYWLLQDACPLPHPAVLTAQLELWLALQKTALILPFPLQVFSKCLQSCWNNVPPTQIGYHHQDLIFLSLSNFWGVLHAHLPLTPTVPADLALSAYSWIPQHSLSFLLDTPLSISIAFSWPLLHHPAMKLLSSWPCRAYHLGHLIFAKQSFPCKFCMLTSYLRYNNKPLER